MVVIEYVFIELGFFKDRGKECFLKGDRDGGSLKGEVDDGSENTEESLVPRECKLTMRFSPQGYYI